MIIDTWYEYIEKSDGMVNLFFYCFSTYLEFKFLSIISFANLDSWFISHLASFVAPSMSVIKNTNICQKNSVYPKTFYLNSFLLLTSTSLQNLYHGITKHCCRNRYALNKESYFNWRGIATYLYSQLTKLLLISRNMNYTRKNLIYLKPVYTFQFN